MSKRMIRIFSPNITDSLPKLLNQELHVVLYNGHTVFGRLKSFTAFCLLINDLRNHIHEIKLTDIEEIILDRQSTRSLTLA